LVDLDVKRDVTSWGADELNSSRFTDQLGKPRYGGRTTGESDGSGAVYPEVKDNLTYSVYGVDLGTV
jgi:hypothetical protein